MILTEREGKVNVAYVRVSTIEQNEDRQVEALGKYEIEKWYKEKVSGKNRNREQLKIMLDFVREGDVIYVLDFSRLSRSVSDLLSIVEELDNKNVKLVSLKENLDSRTPTGRLMLTMIGAISEFERQNMLERQREGINIAKREGRYKGRKEMELLEWDDNYKLWKNGEISLTAFARNLDVTRATIYNRLKKVKKNSENKIE